MRSLRGSIRDHELRRRSGVVLVLCLVTMLIFGGLIAQYSRRVLAERRQFRQEIYYEQTAALADAGVLLAEAAWQKDPKWTGVQWKIPAGMIHQTNSADVVILVRDGQCTVSSRYPANAEIPLQVTRTRKFTP